MGQQQKGSKTTSGGVALLCRLAAKAELPRKPRDFAPSEEYLQIMRKLGIKYFKGNYDKLAAAQAAQERREISSQLMETGKENVDWDTFEDAMIGWAVVLMEESDKPTTAKVVPFPGINVPLIPWSGAS